MYRKYLFIIISLQQKYASQKWYTSSIHIQRDLYSKASILLDSFCEDVLVQDMHNVHKQCYFFFIYLNVKRTGTLAFTLGQKTSPQSYINEWRIYSRATNKQKCGTNF